MSTQVFALTVEASGEVTPAAKMTKQFREMRSATRQHIASAYELPAQMLEGWAAIDAVADEPSGEEELTDG